MELLSDSLEEADLRRNRTSEARVREIVDLRDDVPLIWNNDASTDSCDKNQELNESWEIHREPRTNCGEKGRAEDKLW